MDDNHKDNNECKVTNGAGNDDGEGGLYEVCGFCDFDCNLNVGFTVDDDADNNGDGEHGNINDLVVDDGDVKIDSTLLNDESFDDDDIDERVTWVVDDKLHRAEVMLKMLSVRYTLCTTDGDVDDICRDAYNGNGSSIDTIEHNKDVDVTLLLDVFDAGEYVIFVSCSNRDVDDCSEDDGRFVGNSRDGINDDLDGCE